MTGTVTMTVGSVATLVATGLGALYAAMADVSREYRGKIDSTDPGKHHIHANTTLAQRAASLHTDTLIGIGTGGKRRAESAHIYQPATEGQR